MTNKKFVFLVALSMMVLYSVGVSMAYLKTDDSKDVSVGDVLGTPVTYYVDCTYGKDTNAGTTESTAFGNLYKISQLPLMPGDNVLLKKGCTWQQTMIINASGSNLSNITISSYGSGEMPLIKSNTTYAYPITIFGNYVKVDGISFLGIAPSTVAGCQNVGVGDIKGVFLKGTASYNTVQNSRFEGFSDGMAIDTNGKYNVVRYNNFVNNNMMTKVTSGGDDDYGAIGISLFGDNNEVYNNTFSGGDACSYDYGRDGSAVEIYGGIGNKVYRNRSTNNDTFTELGNYRSANNSFYYNIVTASNEKASFLVTRGPSVSFGPVLGTKAYNNTVYLTGAKGTAVMCAGGCDSTVLTLKNNIIWSEYSIGFSDNTFSESNNIFWKTGGSPLVQFTRTDGSTGHSSTSKTVDPKFKDLANGDFNLLSDSPAIDQGDSEAVSLGFTPDFNSVGVPLGNGIDIGALESGFEAPQPVPTPADTTAPVVNITSPANNAQVSANTTLTLAATATDNVGVQKVDFYVNGVLKCSDTSASYTCSFKVPKKAGVTYMIQARSSDAAGNVGNMVVVVTSR
jgi:hypothetical protein